VRRPASNACDKPVAEAVVCFSGLLLKSFVLHQAGYDPVTVSQQMKPDVDDFKVKALTAFLTVLFCG